MIMAMTPACLVTLQRPWLKIMHYVTAVTNTPTDQATGISEDLTRVLKELAGVFQGNEEKGESVDETLAKIFNNGLRSRPMYAP